MCGTTYSRTAARASESAQAQHRPEGRPQRNLTAQNTRTHTGAAQALGVGKNVDWGKRRARVDAARGGRGEGTCRICNIEPPGLFGLPAARQCGSLRGAPALRRHFFCTIGRKWHAVHASVTQWAIARALQESMRSEGRRFHAGSAGDAWQVVRRGDHGARAESGGIGGRARAAAIPRGEGGGRGPVGRGERRRGAPEAARRSPRRGRTCDEPPFVGPNSAGHECHTLHPLLP